jgi:chemotaxis protein MotB
MTEQKHSPQDDNKSPQGGHQVITLSQSYKNKRKPERKSSAWLLTFTDLSALMLTFFVMLYAMSEPEPQVWSEIVTSMERELLNTFGPMESLGINDTVNLDKVSLNRALKLEYLLSILETHMEEDIANQNILISKKNDTLIVSLPETLLFGSGSATMNAAGETTIAALANALRRIRNRIEIVGHTDNVPLSNTATFPSNWELSLERAGIVAQALNHGGYVRPILIRGYGSVQFENINANFSEDIRKDFSRRVDIHIMNDDGSISQRKLLNY